MDEPELNPTHHNSYWLGGFLIIIGILFLLDNLNIIPASTWKSFWPLILIFIGLRFLTRR